MPSLQLYGRAWVIADDDLICPEMTEGMVRLVWFGILLAMVVLSYLENQYCAERMYLTVYLGVSLASCFVSTLLAFAVAFFSSRGTLANPKPRRRPVRILLYIRFPIILFDLLWTIGGTVLLYSALRPNCPDKLMTAAKNSVIGNWTVLSIFAVFVLILTQAFRPHQETAKINYQNRWMTTLNRVFSCSGSGGKGTLARSAIQDVAAMLGTHFSGTGMVFSDILAGLVLANEKEDNSAPYHTLNPVKYPGTPDWMNLTLASRYITFASGSYGWAHFSAAYGPSAACRIASEMACPCPCSNPTDPPAEIYEDNCCFCNTAVLKYMTDPMTQAWKEDGVYCKNSTERPEMVYFTLHNAVYEIPFSVFLDHATESIVIVIRGSLTLEDWVTDLSVVGEPYTIPNYQGGEITVLGHKGFFESGQYIAQTLAQLGLLDRLLTSYPHYHLVTTGQSLGAGVAPTLALFLLAKYSDVRCFAFSPPGCVIRDTDVWCTLNNICTVIVGDDLVAHMSMQSIDRLRRDIVQLFRRCNLPKYKILQFGFIEACCGRDIDIFAEAEMTVNTSGPEMAEDGLVMNPRGSSKAYSKDTLNSLNSRPIVHGTSDQLNSQSLVLPGVIMYVFQPNPDDDQWHLSWEKEYNFHRIIISGSVINHHFPFTVCKVLEEALKQEQDRSGVASPDMAPGRVLESPPVSVHDIHITTNGAMPPANTTFHLG